MRTVVRLETQRLEIQLRIGEHGANAAWSVCYTLARQKTKHIDKYQMRFCFRTFFLSYNRFLQTPAHVLPR